MFPNCKTLTVWYDNCSGRIKIGHCSEPWLITWTNHLCPWNPSPWRSMRRGTPWALLNQKYDRKSTCIISRTAIEMHPSDFLDYKNEKGNGKDSKCPYIADISVIQFHKGSTKLIWKSSFYNNDFQWTEFLKLKTQINEKTIIFLGSFNTCFVHSWSR